jgi:hypothetical protein
MLQYVFVIFDIAIKVVYFNIDVTMSWLNFSKNIECIILLVFNYYNNILYLYHIIYFRVNTSYCKYCLNVQFE